ncbi:hypothetical protein AGRA3207_004343 [Actinomadura graeca]|uniref:Subtilisin inhibitor domain-containing protein n=1 Tax=Actinomadura graeca TaxID=2750812 RepID=A0ABX8QYZ3_9ACTN|nr:SSI family serine proteinase inhibitor [Actinomadura graeca]QXJ23214.1 hypothetical protein AGRA3207_004343 [Actinomadura graeca]
MPLATTRLLLCLSLLAGGAATVAAPASATASPSAPQTLIHLSVAPQSGRAGRTATLTCDPAGGTHKNAAAACAELAAVGGDIQLVPPKPHVSCLQIWIPVDATATGYWRGQPIKPYSETITNDGCAAIRHGHVLDF